LGKSIQIYHSVSHSKPSGYTLSLHAQCENARLLAELAAARAARRAESASATATKKMHPEGGLTDKRKKLSKLPAKKVGIHGSKRRNSGAV
jgi:hypothetical protein